jgi:GntR family transcriptional regulator / MocR family aminotransferase
VSDSWATSGVDLHLETTGPGVRVGLETALRDAIRDRRLVPGLRVPSSRALAADLGIARNTVADAYAQLIAEGWLAARQGSGTRVAHQPVALTRARVLPAASPLPYDLRAGSPDISRFPRSGWLSAARRAVNDAPSEAFGYGDPHGRLELRQALTGYLARARGVRVTPDRVIICSGFTHGLSLLCRVLRSRGATALAMEAYGTADHRAVAVGCGLRVDTLPIDDHGAVIGRLGDQAGVVLTPAHQFPLGMALAPQRRTSAIEWAADTGGIVIEDDYDGEFRYDRQPVGAMQSLAPELVVFSGTASKSLAPGLRLGWLVLPGHLVDDVTAAKALDDYTPALDQLTLAEFITSGRYDRHIRRSRLSYRRRRDRLVAALQGQAPQIHVTGIAAGLHALLELPPGYREEDIIECAAQRGLALEGLRVSGCTSVYTDSRTEERPDALVIGYGTPPGHAYNAAIALLTAVLMECAPA